MNKFVRRFMSGASLAVLSFGVPTFAVRASAQSTGPAASLRYYEDQILVAAENTVIGDLNTDLLPPYLAVAGHPVVASATDSAIWPFDAGAYEAYITADRVVNDTAFEARAHAYGHVADWADSATAKAEGALQLDSALIADNFVVNKSEGFIAAYATADHAYYELASAAGVDEEAYGIWASNEVVNEGGVIGASANAFDALDANANAYGVEQDATGEVAKNSVVNHLTALGEVGNIEAFAHAWNAGTTYGSGYAVAHAYGVYQDPLALVADNYVENSGLIGAGATAHNAGHVTAIATGIYQGATAILANNTVINSGTVEGYAQAYDADYAKASAAGVVQQVEGDAANNLISNEGLIGAGAFASYADYTAVAHATAVAQSAYGTTAGNIINNGGVIAAGAFAGDADDEARAYAEAIYQSADGYVAGNVVVNSGSIMAFALADNVDGTAYARAVGVDQFATGYASAINVVDNSGLIAAAAIAADAGTYATARAAGVYQSASAFLAKNTVVNNGEIVAFALASDAERAHASAAGVFQTVSDAAEATNFVSNNMIIGAMADAYDAITAMANAAGVHQSVDAEWTAINSVKNGASGVIFGVAAASYAEYASAKAAGVYQKAYSYTSEAFNNVSNDGVIYAGAYASNADAVANATAYAVYQNADGYFADNNVSNNGLIEAYAYASGAAQNFAKAVGIYQTADGYDAANYVLNSNLIEASAQAFHDAPGFAHADAYAVDQLASGYYVSNTVVNNGNIVALATAAYGTSLEANASGVYQRGDVGDEGYNVVQNNGHIEANASAYSGTYANADAVGVGQHLYGDAYLLDNSVENTGFILVGALAAAESAHALADGVYQYASDAEYIGNNFENIWTGVSEPVVQASAAAYGVFASASANGVNQRLYYAGPAGNYVENEGVIFAGAFASANDTADAKAYAVRQWISDVYDGENTLVNYDTIEAKASAVGNDASAKAVGVHQSVEDFYYASNAVENDWWIEARATAQAFATTYSPAPHAVARAVGIEQYAKDTAAAEGYGASNKVSNTWVDWAVASASAVMGEADAYAYGVIQTAQHLTSSTSYAPGVASNFVYNDGWISADAYANAQTAVDNIPAAIDATAKADAISQKIYDATSAMNQVTNDYVIRAYAEAAGQNEVHATAIGVQQSIEDAVYAANSVLNYGGITAQAVARQWAGVGGSYTAEADAYGVRQTMDGVDYAASFFDSSEGNNVLNDGYYTITADSSEVFHPALIIAKATAYAAGNDADATARAEGVEQNIYDATSAENYVYNEGVIWARAVAEGYNANANAVGVGQNIEFADYAGNYVYNEGSITALAYANAQTGSTTYGAAIGDPVAHNAVAGALGVGQDIYDVGSGINEVTNDWGIVADAYAYGLVNAHANATGVRQEASDADYAYNEVLNYDYIGAEAVAEQWAGPSGAHDATANAYGVRQTMDGVEYGASYNTYSGYYEAGNYVYNDGEIFANAAASATGALGHANALAVGVDQVNTGALGAQNYVDNYYWIWAEASALGAHAHATAAGIAQDASGDLLAENTAYNDGWITADAYAKDHFSLTSAVAHAYGIDQEAFGMGAYNSVTNDGVIHAFASASGLVKATADAYGVDQVAFGEVAYNTAENYGFISAKATAHGGTYAYAAAYGIDQLGFGFDYNDNYAENYGTIEAYAWDKDTGQAVAYAAGIDQMGLAEYDVYNEADNYGLIHAQASAYSAYASGTALAAGILQNGFAADTVYDYAYNSGSIQATAKAWASDEEDLASPVVTADAYAQAGGIVQYGVVLNNTYDGLILQAYNDGRIEAKAFAYASDAEYADAVADAEGIYQGFLAPVVHDTVINNGYITAMATARAESATEVYATAFAAGIDIGPVGNIVAGAGALHLEVENNGSIYALAQARAIDGGNAYAYATAIGIAVDNPSTGSGAGLVDGVIDNAADGAIVAEAYANATTDGHSIYGSGEAVAIGIGVKAKEFTGTIENHGAIDAQAFGSTAYATGIFVGNNGAYSTATGDGIVGYVVNDGFIYASENWGAVGNAINVADAPNEIDISLEGGGHIYGNIEDSEAAASWTNKITVSNGVTYFDGSINPGLGTLANGGDLTISANGTLWLPNKSTSYWANNGYVGNLDNPVINVASYVQTGVLKLDVDGSTNVATINAVSATLTGGSVVVNPYAYSLYPNTQTYQVVFGARAGTTWTSVTSTNPSPLLTFAANYPNANEADIVLTRHAFDAPYNVTLTPNEEGVGDGLEAGYSTSLTGEAKLFYESLFQVSAANYAGMLAQLSGVEAGEVAQFNTVSASTFTDKITARLDSLSALLNQGGSAGGNTINVWGSYYGSWTNTAATVDGPGYKTSSNGFAVGADMPIPGTGFIVGSGLTVINKSALPFSNGNRGTSKGFDLAAYGRYNASPDDDSFYVQGSVSYGSYDNTTKRYVSGMPLFGGDPTDMATPPSPEASSLPPYSYPASASGWLSGSFTSSVWSIYGEGGLPIVLDADLNVTPFLGIRYMNSDSGAYTETGSIGGHTSPALHVTDASATSVNTYLGAELAGQLHLTDTQVLMPSARIAWVHDFNNNPWQVDAWFSGVGSTSAFTVDGGRWAQDSALIDFDLSLAVLDNMIATIGYQGNINATQTTNTLMGRVDFKF